MQHDLPWRSQSPWRQKRWLFPGTYLGLMVCAIGIPLLLGGEHVFAAMGAVWFFGLPWTLLAFLPGLRSLLGSFFLVLIVLGICVNVGLLYLMGAAGD